MATKTAPTPENPAPQQGRLHLLIDDGRTPWRLDESTREIGRKGLAQAREALRSARSADLPEAA